MSTRRPRIRRSEKSHRTYRTYLTYSALSDLSQTPRDFFHIAATVKGADPKETFASAAKTASRCDDDLRLRKQPIEKIPTARVARRPRPEIRSIHSAPDVESDRANDALYSTIHGAGRGVGRCRSGTRGVARETGCQR